MDMRSITAVLALSLACVACSLDDLPGVGGEARIETQVLPAEGQAKDVRIVRAESRLPRHGGFLITAAWEKASDACGEADFEPIDAPAVPMDAKSRLRAYEMKFRCSTRRLPNDERVAQGLIYDNAWPPAAEGTQVRSGWAGYSFPQQRPAGAFVTLLGGHVLSAHEACGGRPFVVERIESRTEDAPRKPDGQIFQQRVQGGRLQFRCLDASTRPTFAGTA